MLNELIEQADHYGGLLPRPILNLWDEWGNMPPFNGVDSLFTAARSRGIRSLVAVQTLAQIELRYNKTLSEVIQQSCQIIMFTAVAPIAENLAKMLSQALSDQTVQSGSVSRSDGKSASTTLTMIRKPLLSPAQIIQLPFGHWVIMKFACRPIQTTLPRYFMYLPKLPMFSYQKRINLQEIHFSTSDKIRAHKERAAYRLEKGMFD